MATTISGLRKELNNVKNQVYELKKEYDEALDNINAIHKSEMKALKRIQDEKLRDMQNWSKNYVATAREQLEDRISEEYKLAQARVEGLQRELDRNNRILEVKQRELELAVNNLTENERKKEAFERHMAEKSLKQYDKECHIVRNGELPVELFYPEEVENYGNTTSAQMYFDNGLYGAAVGIADVNITRLRIMGGKTRARINKQQQMFDELDATFHQLDGVLNSSYFTKYDGTNPYLKNVTINKVFLKHWSNHWYSDVEQSYKDIGTFITTVKSYKTVCKYIKDTRDKEFESRVYQYIIDLRLMTDELLKIRAFAISNCEASNDRVLISNCLNSIFDTIAFNVEPTRRLAKADQPVNNKRIFSSIQAEISSNYDIRLGITYEAMDLNKGKRLTVVLEPYYDLEKLVARNTVYAFADSLVNEDTNNDSFVSLKRDFTNAFRNILEENNVRLKEYIFENGKMCESSLENMDSFEGFDRKVEEFHKNREEQRQALYDVIFKPKQNV